MHTIEFEADIENGVIHIPENYKILKKVRAKVIVLTEEKQPTVPVFNPRTFFGAANHSKTEIDAYLQEVREDWQ